MKRTLTPLASHDGGERTASWLESKAYDGDLLLHQNTDHLVRSIWNDDLVPLDDKGGALFFESIARHGRLEGQTDLHSRRPAAAVRFVQPQYEGL